MDALGLFLQHGAPLKPQVSVRVIVKEQVIVEKTQFYTGLVATERDKPHNSPLKFRNILKIVLSHTYTRKSEVFNSCLLCPFGYCPELQNLHDGCCVHLNVVQNFNIYKHLASQILSMPMGDAGDYRNWADLRDLLLQLVSEATVDPQVLYTQDGKLSSAQFLSFLTSSCVRQTLSPTPHKCFTLDLKMPSNKLLKDLTWLVRWKVCTIKKPSLSVECSQKAHVGVVALAK